MKHWILDASALLETSLGQVLHELNELDWKQKLSPKKDRLAEHLSAFANYPNGGVLIFGVDEKTGIPEGIEQAESDSIIGQLANIGRDSLEPPVTIDHAIVEFRNTPLLFVFIKESGVKPVHLRGKPLDHCYIRSGGTTRKASRQEVGSLMLNSRNPCWETLRASTLLRSEEILKKIDIEGIHRLLNRPLPEKPEELLRWLTGEKIIEPDGSGYYVGNFGAIAAANRIAEFEGLERKRLRVIRYKGLNKVETIDETEVQKGYAVGFGEIIEHLKNILPHSEVIEKALRREVGMYPEIALRELIANALIHQDFTIQGTGPMVEIFDNRIEFINPGSLPPSKKIDRLIGTTPESRNEILARAFRRYRICEERGTGFLKVVASIELFGLPPVAFEQGENYFKVTLFAPRKLSEMLQAERVEACYQHAVLKYLSGSAMTNTTLRERLKMHEKKRTQVSNLIREAVEAGRIKRKDPTSLSSKFAEYIPYWV
ncbi:MAG: ATP-binding protein [Deltaproteobacteria bacterium]|nr:ATP-binding protein [Deltaproteobacteria bacterium]